MAKKTNGAMQILKDNAWAIILIVVGWAIGFALLQQQVNTLAAEVSQYPSEDWFELKFQNIDNRLDDLESKLQ